MTEAIAKRASEHGRLAIDTEFVSERRYQAQLCLVQVAVPDADGPEGVRTDVLDPLDEAVPLDPAPLARVLADPAVQVTMHAGRQDVAILRRTWDTDITNVFDTQVAAGFLGFGNQEGYESLVRGALGVNLKGGEGFTRWDKRPLTKKQISYAADDARLLLALGTEMESRLAEKGRLEWAREESLLVQASRDERSPERAYERLPRLARLDAGQRAAARRLCEWREGLAREADRPPSYIVPDQALIELARRRPRDRAALESIRGLPQQTLHRRGADLIEQIRASRDDDSPPASPAAQRRDPAEAPLVSLAQAVVRHRSAESGVATELIATQSELSALVGAVRRGTESTGVRALSGWRRELVGDELRELIEGRRAVSVAADGGLVVTRA
ncbi:MAG: ribonuclease D [Actinomycetota bacterium]|nr:ribonuclease D [Actinomycetota bacterium]